MPTETANVFDVEPRFDAMYRLREALGTDAVGLTVVDCEPGWEGPEHEHGEQGHEEIYLLLEGAASITVDGETVDLEPGDAIRIDPTETRQIHNGDAASRLILAGANR